MQGMKSDIRVYLQPAFLICAAVLATAGAGMSIAIKTFGMYLKKEPLPLRKSLDLLDEKQLGSYKVLSKDKIENHDVLKELGTEDYIQWILEDTEIASESPVRKFMLFVTYYELPDRVPHVPEECWTGAGYTRLATEGVTFRISNPDLPSEIRGKYLVFGGTKTDFLQGIAKFPILYLFKVNGEYAGSRDAARIVLNKNLFGKYSYFSKIELVFNQSLSAPSKQEATEASEKVLGVILPILEKDHWPDWKGSSR
jgi:hypothetical protein